jgi:Rps23 Pro-64 3,4-dihydroxylase Tpa1-like proline 4-hydroxylase
VNKKELIPGVVVYSDINDNLNFIDFIINSNLLWQQSLSVINNEEVYDDKRTSKYIYIPHEQESNNSIQENLRQKIINFSKEAEEDYKNEYEIQTKFHDGYSILKYEKGDKCAEHIDNNEINPRTISTVWYLNEDYKGGEIYFPRFNLKYKPLKNELLIFPSFYVYNHEVLPVTEGTRYSIVSWLN